MNTNAWNAAGNFRTFSQIGQSVLEMLRHESGLPLWAVARVGGEFAPVLAVAGEGFGIRPAALLRWADTLFARTVAGEGPAFCPDLADAAGYATAPMARSGRIGAYVGIALGREPSGFLFGLDSRPHASFLALEPVAREAAGILETLLTADEAISRAVHEAAAGIAEGKARFASRVAEWRRVREAVIPPPALAFPNPDPDVLNRARA